MSDISKDARETNQSQSYTEPDASNFLSHSRLKKSPISGVIKVRFVFFLLILRFLFYFDMFGTSDTIKSIIYVV